MEAHEKTLLHDESHVKRMTKLDYLGDASGQFGYTLLVMTAGQLTYFYTDKLGLAVGLVGACLAVSRIVEAIISIFLGHLVEKSPKGNKKYISLLGKLILPAGIGLLLMFTVPVSLGKNISMAYVFITNILVPAIIVNLILNLYQSLQVVRTKSKEERSTMGIFRAIASFVGGMIISISIFPITNLMGGDKNAWTKYGLAVSALLILFLSICYFSSRNKIIEEVEVKEEAPKIKVGSLKTNLIKILKNKYLVMVLLVNLFVFTNHTLSGTAGIYYAKWIFGNENLVATLGAISLIPTAIGFLVTAPCVKHFGVMGTMKISGIIGVLSTLIKCLFPTNLSIFIITSLFFAFSTVLSLSLMGVMAAMAIDYNAVLYSDGFVALSNGAIGFGNKLGSVIATVFLSTSLSLANYNPEMASVTNASRQAIYAFSNWLPLIASILLLIVYTRFDLEKKISNTQKELKQ